MGEGCIEFARNPWALVAIVAVAALFFGFVMSRL